MPYKITLAAEGDIEDIIATIWQENPKAADAVEDRLYAAFDLLAANPGLGHERSDLTNLTVLFWPIRQTSHVAIYRQASPIEIIRVIHWRRDIAAVLSGKE